MTEEIQDYDDELRDLEDEVAKGIKALASLSNEDRLKGVKNLQKRLERGKQLMDGFVIELRELAPSEAAPFKAKQGEHESRLAALRQQLEGIQHDTEREALGLGTDNTKAAAVSSSSGGGGPKSASDINKEADELLAKGAAKQKETLSAVDRINQKIAETEKVGVAINEQLVADREKLQQMKEDFEDIDDGIKQSKKLLGQFWRRLQRDNCIRALAILILIGVLFIMIWSLVDPDFGKKKSSASASSSLHAPLSYLSVLVSLGLLLAFSYVH